LIEIRASNERCISHGIIWYHSQAVGTAKGIQRGAYTQRLAAS
jgi:hypothetical protein